jgi:nucleotide-binding universal stress UspA family protein
VESLKNLGVGEGAEIVLLHSVQPPSPDPLNQRQEQELAQRQKDARDYLGHVAAIAPDGHMYRLLTPIEDPATAILESVETQELDLIVIAAHARRGRVRFSPTSVAGQVLRDTGTPVLIVRGVDEVEPLPETALPEVEQSECEEDNYFDEFLFV